MLYCIMRVNLKSSYHREKYCIYVEWWILRLNVVITSKYIQISDHVIHLKLISIIPQFFLQMVDFVYFTINFLIKKKKTRKKCQLKFTKLISWHTNGSTVGTMPLVLPSSPHHPGVPRGQEACQAFLHTPFPAQLPGQLSSENIRAAGKWSKG